MEPFPRKNYTPVEGVCRKGRLVGKKLLSGWRDTETGSKDATGCCLCGRMT